MYNPAPFAEDHIGILHAFIRQHPLAALITNGPDGPEAAHVPVVLHAEESVLRCHLARGNPQWKTIQSSAPVLAVFQGPEHYISPSWYPSKAEHGKVAPTWNYVAVHVRGRGRIFEDRDSLLNHLRALTGENENTFETPWSIDDAPADYIEGLSRGIVGVEISIEAIEGKWKASQNRPRRDREGVVEGLNALGSSRSLQMARIVKERS